MTVLRPRDEFWLLPAELREQNRSDVQSGATFPLKYFGVFLIAAYITLYELRRSWL
jgi:hypothetical protein